MDLLNVRNACAPGLTLTFNLHPLKPLSAQSLSTLIL